MVVYFFPKTIPRLRIRRLNRFQLLIIILCQNIQRIGLLIGKKSGNINNLIKKTGCTKVLFLDVLGTAAESFFIRAVAAFDVLSEAKFVEFTVVGHRAIHRSV